ncbi:hypothetical protein [Actinomadura sp. 21ATH]|uniref:hypothetical protein n=1 Tax=Actinomadura sp. 21ATH TaxID=1735444 RepID=UPI0035BF65F3
MFRDLLAFALLAAAAVGAAALVVVTDVPAAVLLSVAAVGLGLAWLLLLLTVPWNVHFRARRVLQDIRTSRDRGLEIPDGHEAEARRIASRARTAAIGAHLVTAAAVAAVTYFSGESTGYYFAGFYLLSTLFRPSHAWFAHLRDRLRTMDHEARHPRDDVLALRTRLEFAEGRLEAMRLAAEQLHEADRTLEHRLEAVDITASQGTRELERRIDALGRRFEDTVSQLTDNQEVISGIKAFLRLLRTESA